jgi:hypothetical protein
MLERLMGSRKMTVMLTMLRSHLGLASQFHPP